MKLCLSPVTLAALVTAAVGLAGCNDGDPTSLNRPQTPAETGIVDPNAVAPPRQLIEGRAMPTSPTNLITDPAFNLIGEQAGYGSFISFYDRSSASYTPDIELDSRSPAGFTGGVAIVRPRSATNTKSEPIVMLTSFLGGKGPFHAQVWVSRSDINGEPIELEEGAFTATVTDDDPDRGKAFELAVVPEATRKVGNRSWLLLRATIKEPLARGGFILLRTGNKGGETHIAAPEITSEEIAVGQAVRSSSAVATKARGVTKAERAAMVRYKSIPPRLVPATPKQLRRGE